MVVVGSRPGRVIPKAIIKIIKTASLLGTQALGCEVDSAARLF